MFSKSSNRKGGAAQQPPAPPAPPSIISRDLKIVGDLMSEGEIQIDGNVDGDVRTRILIVGEGAKVKGEIVADTVRILGAVDGQIKAKIVKLAASAHVVGDILHEDLAIETGAFLEGHCKRMAMPDDIHSPSKHKAATQTAQPVATDNKQGGVKPAGKPAAMPAK